MTKNKIQSLKGFRDFLPEDAIKREWLRSKMIEVFEKWGFDPLETPTLEPLELFEGQIGEDEKLFYQFVDPGGRKVALRYDQTVPACRVLGENINNITFPFKRYQIQTAFRAEKPQKGRYREFVQADIDIFGVKSPTADAECIAVSIDLYLTLGFKNVVALINNRDLLKDVPYPVIAAIDKIKKIGKAGVICEIINKGYKKTQAENFLSKIENLEPDKKLIQIFDHLKKLGFSENNFKFEPTLARSFSYSEGPIWEMVIPEYSVASLGGSVGGGERYDAMIKKITGNDIAGTGIAFGFDRTLEAAESLNLIPSKKTVTKVLVTIFAENTLDSSIKIVKILRSAKVNTELYPEIAPLTKQLKYADKKGIPYVVIIGPDEIVSDQVVIKNLVTKRQEKVPLKSLVTQIV